MARHLGLLLLYVYNLWYSIRADSISSISLYTSEPQLKEGSACVLDHSGVTINGTCVNLYKCNTAVRGFVNVKASFEEEYPVLNCSVGENRESFVCCTDNLLDDTERLKEVLIENQNTYDGKDTKAWIKCVEYFTKLPYHCPNKSKLLIPTVNNEGLCTNISYGVPGEYSGVYAQADEFPHMALLGYGVDPLSGPWLCGGTIISERFILSAAHCSSVPQLGNVTFAALGILKRTDLNKCQVYRIKTIIKHPQYNSPSKYHDIMLLETENQINFGKSILPACLDTGKVSDYVLTATGWGRQDPTRELENNLRAIKLHKYDNDLCSELFPPHRHFKNGYDNETQMCYGGANKNVDTCEGDSGGPLQKIFPINCVYNILGITSYGKDCGIPGNAGIYTRVRYYVSWIESIVWTD